MPYRRSAQSLSTLLKSRCRAAFPSMEGPEAPILALVSAFYASQAIGAIREPPSRRDTLRLQEVVAALFGTSVVSLAAEVCALRPSLFSTGPKLLLPISHSPGPSHQPSSSSCSPPPAWEVLRLRLQRNMAIAAHATALCLLERDQATAAAAAEGSIDLRGILAQRQAAHESFLRSIGESPHRSVDRRPVVADNSLLPAPKRRAPPPPSSSSSSSSSSRTPL